MVDVGVLVLVGVDGVVAHGGWTHGADGGVRCNADGRGLKRCCQLWGGGGACGSCGCVEMG